MNTLSREESVVWGHLFNSRERERSRESRGEGASTVLHHLEGCAAIDVSDVLEGRAGTVVAVLEEEFERAIRGDLADGCSVVAAVRRPEREDRVAVVALGLEFARVAYGRRPRRHAGRVDEDASRRPVGRGEESASKPASRRPTGGPWAVPMARSAFLWSGSL